MENYMLFLQYALLATVVVFSADKLGKIVDELDNRTNISGALIGGVVLAAITSLPEFITSVISAVVIGEPSYAFGNIFGSNLFNLAIFSVLDILFIKRLILTHVTEAKKTNVFVVFTYVLIFLPFLAEMVSSNTIQFSGLINEEILLFLQSFEIFGVSYVSFALLIVYYYSLKALNTKVTLLDHNRDALFKEENEEEENDSDSKFSKYSIKRLIITLILFSIVLVTASYIITLVTNEIAVVLDLNASVAGALFLGIATSLPELTSTITLIRLKNYEAAAGGIIGSNMFNFVILVVVDLVSRENIISLIINNPLVKENALILLILGLINSIILLLALSRGHKFTSKIIYIIPSILIVVNYIFYLLVSLV